MKFKPKDFLLLEIACKVGAFTYEIANTLNVKSKRIKQLENEGYIYKRIYNEKQKDGGYKKKYWYV